MFEFEGACYLISFRTEGVEQFYPKEVDSDPEDKGDEDSDPEEEDLLDDEADESKHRKTGTKERDRTGEEKKDDQSKFPESSENASCSKKGSKTVKQVRRSLDFFKVQR